MAGPDLPRLQCTARSDVSPTKHLTILAISGPRTFFRMQFCCWSGLSSGRFQSEELQLTFVLHHDLPRWAICSGWTHGWEAWKTARSRVSLLAFCVLFFCASLSDVPLLSSGGRPGILLFVHNLPLCSQGLLIHCEYKRSLEFAVPYPAPAPQLFGLTPRQLRSHWAVR